MTGQTEVVKLGHGAGGTLTKQLIERAFLKYFRSKALLELGDSAILSRPNSSEIAFTTDSYVVSPIFFPGGNIGKLSISGTVNDLVAAGAKPLYISAGFIIEEGFPMDQLEEVAKSMSETAKTANVEVVTADTKVVEHGKGDGLFINTAGIGVIGRTVSRAASIGVGDVVIVSGAMGNHGATILLSRKRDELSFETKIESDCAPLDGMLLPLYEEYGREIRWVRDVTRGGLFTILNEGMTRRNIEMVVSESTIPVDREVQSICDILGLDPFYLANEGKVAMVVSSKIAEGVIKRLRKHEHGRDAAIIGKVRKGDGHVYVETVTGGLRIAEPLLDDPVPRIC